MTQCDVKTGKKTMVVTWMTDVRPMTYRAELIVSMPRVSAKYRDICALADTESENVSIWS